MDTLHQIFTTVTAALLFFILIAKFASYVVVTNGDQGQLTSNNVETNKSKKKVRFEVDHDDFVINKVIAEPSETRSVVFEQNHGEMEDVNNSNKEPGIDLVQNVGNCNLDEKCDDGIDESLNQKEGLISEEDDWEGVERSDLEKLFALAADYGKVDDNLQNLESEILMQLYGLHKVATEGPCYGGQPMALKVSARAKWNAWQKLGNMNPDVAMEQYITLLSDKVPGWSQGIRSDDKN